MSTYKNMELSPATQRFRVLYKSVIDAVEKLKSGDVEVMALFDNVESKSRWRRRCYEYQKLTGFEFRVEHRGALGLAIRQTTRVQTTDPIFPDDLDIDHRAIAEDILLDQTAEDIPPELVEAVERGKAKAHEALKMRGLKKDFDPALIDMEGADDRRPESGGDAADTGSSSGDD